MTLTTMRDKLRLLMVALGVCCLLAASVVGVGLLRFKSAVGTVEMYEGIEAGQSVMRPTISYTRFNGTRWGYSPPPDELPITYKAGDSVTVLYDPKGKTAHIASVRRWIFPLIAGAVGASLILLELFRVRCGPPHSLRSHAAESGGSSKRAGCAVVPTQASSPTRH